MAALGVAAAKATVKGRYDVDKNAATAVATVALNAGDVKLKASATDATFVNGPSLSGVTLSVERPGAFIIDYNVPGKDWRFQFMNTIRLKEKPVSLTYIHFRGANRATLDGTVTFDPANKVTCNYAFGTGDCKLKYAYAHGSLRRTLFEPSYDISKGVWDFAVSRKYEGDDTLKASYETSKKNLKLEWSRDSKVNGTFKIVASLDLAEQQKFPKLTAESTWSSDLF